MKYPVNENVGLVGGKFTGGNPATGVPPSRLSANWMNAVSDEIINALIFGGKTPTEGDNDQLAEVLTDLKNSLTALANRPWWNIPGVAIGQFVSAMIEPAAYLTHYPNCLPCNGAPINITQYPLYADWFAPVTGSARALTPLATRLGLTLNLTTATITTPDFSTNIPFFRNGVAGIGSFEEDKGRNLTGRLGGRHLNGGANPTGVFGQIGGGDFPSGSGWGGIDFNFDASRVWGAAHTGNQFQPKNITSLALIKVK